jgi:hypothetical protein
MTRLHECRRSLPERVAVLGCTEAPPSSSRLTVAFAPQLLPPTCRAISASPPPRGSRPACIRITPSAAVRARPPPFSTSNSQCRLTSSAASSSTVSDVLHAWPCRSRAKPLAAAARHAVVLHVAQLLLLFLLLDTRSPRPCRITPAHARTACASAPRLPRHHALAPLTPAPAVRCSLPRACAAARALRLRTRAEPRCSCAPPARHRFRSPNRCPAPHAWPPVRLCLRPTPATSVRSPSASAAPPARAPRLPAPRRASHPPSRRRSCSCEPLLFAARQRISTRPHTRACLRHQNLLPSRANTCCRSPGDRPSPPLPGSAPTAAHRPSRPSWPHPRCSRAARPQLRATTACCREPPFARARLRLGPASRTSRTTPPRAVPPRLGPLGAAPPLARARAEPPPLPRPAPGPRTPARPRAPAVARPRARPHAAGASLIGGEREGKMELNRAAAVGKKIRAPGIREQRRRMNRFPQGPIRKYRKLQGPDCKTKFPVDLKPK